MKSNVRAVAAASLARRRGLANVARAETPPPQGVLGLSANASVEVAKDLLAVTFSTTRDGTDANTVQAQLKQALDAALAEAKKAARPGQVDVQTGNFSSIRATRIHRARAAPTITGWQGSAEVIVEGRDMAAIGQLTGRITTMTIARVAYVSRARRASASRPTSRRGDRRISRQGDELREAVRLRRLRGARGVGRDQRRAGRPMPTMRMQATAAARPTRCRSSRARRVVTATVNGTVQMKMTKASTEPTRSRTSSASMPAACIAWPTGSGSAGGATDRVLVCAHGVSRQGRDFDMLARAMRTAGASSAPTSSAAANRIGSPILGYPLPTYVADMVTLLARLDAKTVHWFGTSMGGLIGIARSPARVADRRLVLNDVGPMIDPAGITRIAGYLGLPLTWASEDEAADYLLTISQGFGPHSREQWLALDAADVAPRRRSLRLHYDPAIGVPLQAITPAAATAGEAALWAAYDAVRCPTLVLRGAESDVLAPATAAAMAARGPKARVHEFAGVGHAPTIVAADQVAVVREFLPGRRVVRAGRTVRTASAVAEATAPIVRLLDPARGGRAAATRSRARVPSRRRWSSAASCRRARACSPTPTASPRSWRRSAPRRRSAPPPTGPRRRRAGRARRSADAALRRIAGGARRPCEKARRAAAGGARCAARGRGARAQVERVRKMLLAFSRDLRVVLLRLASRLRRCASSRPARAVPERLRAEAMQVFAPLANRLGIWQIKWELEDLAFRFLEPETLQPIAQLLDEKRADREARIAAMRAQPADELAAHGIDGRGAGPAEAHLLHLEQDARQGARLRRRCSTSAPCA